MTSLNGWTAVPLNPSQLFQGKTYNHPPWSLKVDGIQFPSDDALVLKTQNWAKEKLPLETYNHSMRVFYYAMAIIQQQFPEYFGSISPSTVAITSLLHDIGTAEENHSITRMSFDFYGGVKARSVLINSGGAQDQADAVCEAIIRHADFGTVGNITFLGQMIQLATIFDNVSEHPLLANMEELIHVDTREDVIRAFPRRGWLGCFARTLQKEVELKPWCHTTAIPDFKDKILGNRLMLPYE